GSGTPNISGIGTFSAQSAALSATSNQLVLGTTHTTTITSAAPASSVTATIPALSASDTFAFLNQAQTLTNKTLDSSTTYLADTTDNTKKGQFDLSGISTGTTQTYALPDSSGTICLSSGNCAGSGGSVGG